MRKEPEIFSTIVEMYSLGKEQKEITETIGRDYAFVRYWLKKKGLYDPARRVHNTDLARAQLKSRQTRLREAENRMKRRIESLGFEYVGGYTSKRGKVTLRCKECGETFEHCADSGRRYGIRCPACQLRKRKEQQAVKEARAIARQQAEIERESRKVEAKERFFNEPHVCKECGQTFSYRTYCMLEGVPEDNISKVVFCSDRCRRRHTSRLHSRGKHIRRAKKYGVEYDRSVTLEKLIEKKGLSCSICGLTCFYSGDSNADLYPSIDHIIPLSRGGGHTWENVQVAHRICNTIKNDQVGKEWNNGN